MAALHTKLQRLARAPRRKALTAAGVVERVEQVVVAQGLLEPTTQVLWVVMAVQAFPRLLTERLRPEVVAVVAVQARHLVALVAPAVLAAVVMAVQLAHWA